MSFDKAKSSLLESLANGVDYSPKGSIDYPVRELVDFLNMTSNYVTTSSCSGRVSIYETSSSSKGINWLLVKHETVNKPSVLHAIMSKCTSPAAMIMLKCEPFILHVQCRDIDSARHLHQLAMGCGYRESGISIGAKKVMVAVRTTAFSLELPLAIGQRVLLDDFTLDLVIQEANSRLRKNFSRIDKFLSALKTTWGWPQLSVLQTTQTLADAVSDPDSVPLQRFGHVNWLTATQCIVLGGSGEHRAQASGGASRKIPPVSVDGNTLATVPLTAAASDSTALADSQRVHGCIASWTAAIVSEPTRPEHYQTFTVLSGGRSSLASPLPCCAVVKEDAPDSKIDVITEGSEAAPPARWGHSLSRLSKVGAKAGLFLLVGGRDESQLLGDVYLLELRLEVDQETHTAVARWTNLTFYSQRSLVSPIRPTADGSISPLSPFNVCFHAAAPVSTFFSSAVARPMDSASLPFVDLEDVEHDAVIVHGGIQDLQLMTCAGYFRVIYPFSSTEGLLTGANASTAEDTSSSEVERVDSSIENKDVATATSSVQLATVQSKPLELRLFGHSLTAIGAKTLVIAGGTSFDGDLGAARRADYVLQSGVTALDIEISPSGDLSGSLRQLSLHSSAVPVLPCAACRVHHTAAFDPVRHRLYLLGGGAQCLSFGMHYCASIILQCRLAATASSTDSSPYLTAANPTSATAAVKRFETTRAVDVSVVLLVATQHVKAVKVLLESTQLLDKSRRITRADGTLDVVRSYAFTADDSTSTSASTSTVTETDFSSYMSVPVLPELSAYMLGHHASASAAIVSAVQALGSILGAAVVVAKQRVRESKVAVTSSYRRASDYLADVIRSHQLPDNAVQGVPKKFELVADVLMIPEGCLDRDGWEAFALPATGEGSSASASYMRFWSGLADCFGVTRVARKAAVDVGEMRESRVRLILPPVGQAAQTGPGSIGWVTVLENGIHFSFDLTRVMFCSGNVTERMRMGQQPARDQTIVDLYCGVGYYTVPFLVHAKAKHVHACEWNPNSILALKNNLAQAGVADRCSVYEGDNAESIKHLQSIADRVCCGLLPSSVKGWPLAVQALRPEGGTIHVHENVMDSIIATWTEDACSTFADQFAAAGKPMSVQCVKTEVVKSYAPRVKHIVVDLVCTPIAK